VSRHASKYTVVQKKNPQSSMVRHFATVCSRITRFSPKFSEINWKHEEWANFEYCD